MLYLFHGSDIRKNSEKARSLISSLRIKRPEAAFVRIDGDSWKLTNIDEHIGGRGLFSERYIIFLDRVTENPEAEEKITDLIQAMNESANIFIVLEGKLGAELKRKFEQYAEKIVESSVATGSGRKTFAGEQRNPTVATIFAIADAVSAKNSFEAWSLYRRAIDNGMEAENIVGTLFWQTKTMILSARSKSATEAGLNPFVFGRAKKFASNFTETELKGLAKELITIYHEAHRGTCDLEMSTERVLLSIDRAAAPVNLVARRLRP